MSPDLNSLESTDPSLTTSIPPEQITTRPTTTSAASASFNSPKFPAQTSLSVSRGFNIERIYEFEAPQFYDFTKQSDPERGPIDEHWFDSRRRTPSSPDFHFIARTSSSVLRPKSASGKLCQSKAVNFSGSNGGLSFMNTPVGRGQTFIIPSSVGSVVALKPRIGLKKSATTENVTNCLLSDSSSTPSTIIKSFMSTPLLVIKTPNSNRNKDLPRSPLQKVTKRSKYDLLIKERAETSETAIITTSVINESNGIEGGLGASVLSSTDCSVPNTSVLSNMTLSSNSNSISISYYNSSIISSSASTVKNKVREQEHESFQAGIKARIIEERERIESQAAIQTRKIQKLKAGPRHLPTKSTKPLTIPKSFNFGCHERAKLKKLNHQTKTQTQLPTNVSSVQVKVDTNKFQKFKPTIPKSPLFASKPTITSNKLVSTENKLDSSQPIQDKPSSSQLLLRRKLEYRPIPIRNITSNVTIPKSPKLSSIHRNRNKK